MKRIRTCLVVAAAAFLILPLFTAAGEVPLLMNYQGRLVDGTNLVNGNVSLVLSLYDSPNNTTRLYGDSNVITVVDGLYSTFIGDDTTTGSLTDALTNTEVWIEVEVDGMMLLPRERMVAVGYALMAGGVSDGAITGDMIANDAVANVHLGDNVVNGRVLANNAVSGSHIANSSVGSVHLATSSVGSDELARDYQSGSFTFSGREVAFAREIIWGTDFSPAFATTPVVMLSIQSRLEDLVDQTRVVPNTQDMTSFTARVLLTDQVDEVRQFGGSVARSSYTSLALLPNGWPAIGYYEWDTDDLFFVHANDTNGTSWASPVLADSADDVGDFVSLEIVSGRPAMAYWNASSNCLMYVRALNSTGSSWGTSLRLDEGQSAGQYCSLAVVKGRPAIAYYDEDDGDLKYIRADNTTGSAWGKPVRVDSVNDTGLYASLVVADNKPAMAYYDRTSHQLKYVRADDTTGAAWTAPVVVDDTPFMSQRLSMAIVGGRPAISYHRWWMNQELRYVRANDAVGFTWDAPVTITEDAVSLQGVTSLAVVQGHPSVVFRRNQFPYGESSLNYARALDAVGNSWGYFAEIADSGGNASLGVLSNGEPMASYTYPSQLGFVRPGSETNDLTLLWIAVEP